MSRRDGRDRGDAFLTIAGCTGTYGLNPTCERSLPRDLASALRPTVTSVHSLTALAPVFKVAGVAIGLTVYVALAYLLLCAVRASADTLGRVRAARRRAALDAAPPVFFDRAALEAEAPLTTPAGRAGQRRSRPSRQQPQLRTRVKALSQLSMRSARHHRWRRSAQRARRVAHDPNWSHKLDPDWRRDPARPWRAEPEYAPRHRRAA